MLPRRVPVVRTWKEDNLDQDRLDDDSLEHPP